MSFDSDTGPGIRTRFLTDIISQKDNPIHHPFVSLISYNDMKLTELYEESQSKLNDTTDELEAMKKYLNEVLEEVDKFRKTK